MATKRKPSARPAVPKKAIPLDFDQFEAEVEKRAKEIFLKRVESKSSGDAISDWLQAEEEIKTKHYGI
jgi:hypothetical protein